MSRDVSRGYICGNKFTSSTLTQNLLSRREPFKNTINRILLAICIHHSDRIDVLASAHFSDPAISEEDRSVTNSEGACYLSESRLHIFILLITSRAQQNTLSTHSATELQSMISFRYDCLRR